MIIALIALYKGSSIFSKGSCPHSTSKQVFCIAEAAALGKNDQMSLGIRIRIDSNGFRIKGGMSWQKKV
jgi:hypothetical protein